MEIHLINDKINSYEFNQAVLHPTQTWEWNESLVKLGYEVIRIGEYKNNKLQNAFSIYFREIPYASFKIGYLSMSSYPSREVRQFLETIAKLKKCIVIKVKLATFTKNSRNKVETEKNNVLLHGTLIIDLKKNEHDLLADMKPKTRYNIHLAERKLVSVKEINNFDGLKIFYRLYLETCKRKRYQGQTCNYFQTLFETLSKSMFHIFIAFYKSVPLAANLVILFRLHV
ncbi:aminoacyltransferase, partial [Patescibacteria group bacterium]|nr:aminoacyltransferase [Patescibacteria group bacterium]